MITANVRVIARLVRGKVNTPLSKKSIVKNPLQVNKRTARARWIIAGRGKRWTFSETGGLEAFMTQWGLRFVDYPVGFSDDWSQVRHTRGRRFKNLTFPLARQA